MAKYSSMVVLLKQHLTTVLWCTDFSRYLYIIAQWSNVVSTKVCSATGAFVQGLPTADELCIMILCSDTMYLGGGAAVLDHLSYIVIVLLFSVRVSCLKWVSNPELLHVVAWKLTTVLWCTDISICSITIAHELSYFNFQVNIITLIILLVIGCTPLTI